MINTIKKLLGLEPKIDYAQLVKNGAAIVDVRTNAEYQQGHIQGSVNIPLNNLSNQYSKLDKAKPVITCCASGIRSAQAKNLLTANGFTEVYNGGGWQSLSRNIE